MARLPGTAMMLLLLLPGVLAAVAAAEYAAPPGLMPPTNPPWEPTWDLARSTITMTCNGSACVFCVVVVRPVSGWPKSMNWAGEEPAHVVCKTCFKAGAEDYERLP